MQSFGHVVRGLEILHHAAIAANGGLMQTLALIEAANSHFLAGQVVSAKVNLQPGVTGIGGVRKAVGHILQRGHGGLGRALVALRE
jgi:hypothetical protein